MAELHPLNDEERDELIAYLDGELSVPEARTIERRIDSDARYRAEADALRKTYNLLDYLPKPEPSPSFTHRTMSHVGELRPRTTSVRLPRTGWKTVVGWTAAVMAACVLGWFGVELLPSAVRPKSIDAPAEVEQQLTRDQRLLERLGYYQHVDDLSFLNELDLPDLFGDDHGP